MFEKIPTEPQYLLWLDYETNGLYGYREDGSFGEDHYDILEVGYFITDSEFNIISPMKSYVVTHDVDKVIEKSNDYVVDMHTQNKLFEDIRNGETTSLFEIEQIIINDVRTYCGDVAPQLAGSSIHFDRIFLSHQMPALNDVLHYRNFDSSTIATFLKVAYKYAEIKDGESDHRALDDIKTSLRTVQRIKEFLAPKGPL